MARWSSTVGHLNFDDINMEKNYRPVKAYDQSKLANVLFTRELHRRLEGSFAPPPEFVTLKQILSFTVVAVHSDILV